MQRTQQLQQQQPPLCPEQRYLQQLLQLQKQRPQPTQHWVL
jgi:hypothetical protein